MVLNRIVEHAYGTEARIGKPLESALTWMRHRLLTCKPKRIDSTDLQQFFVYTDAAFEPETSTGGLGAVLVSEAGICIARFGIFLDSNLCEVFGSSRKDTIIYELEELCFWKPDGALWRQ